MPAHRPGHRRGHERCLVTAALLGTSMLGAADARAEVVVRAAADGLLLVGSDAVAGGGLGAAAFGYNLELEPLILLPEIYGSFGGYGGDFAGVAARVTGGLRAGFAGPVEPTLFVRGGYGWTGMQPSAAAELAGWDGFHLQTGAGLDYRIGRELTVGGEAFYDVGFVADQGVTAELHALGLGAVLGFWL